MTNTTKLIALVGSIAISSLALPVEVNANTPSCPDIVDLSVDGEVVQLPTDVAANVAMLQSYADRYARVVATIVEEYRKPAWSFESACTLPTDTTDAADS